MSTYRKVIIDRNLGEGLKDAFGRCKAPVTVTLSSDVVSGGAYAPDSAILEYAHKNKMHIISADSHFSHRGAFICDEATNASCTVVKMRISDFDTIAKTVLAAWRKVGWRVVKSSPVLEVYEHEATLYTCDENRRFVPVKPPYRY